MFDVAIARNADPAAAVTEALALLGGMTAFVRPGDRVLIKPNFLVSENKPGVVTSGPVIIEVTRQVLQAGGQPIIGEAGSTASGLDAFRNVGVVEFAAAHGVPLKNLNEDEMVEVDIPDAVVFPKVKVARTALEVDRIVNLPVLKTHDQCWVSFSIKNVKGLLPTSEKMRSHAVGVEQAIVDLNRRFPPALVVIDGIVGQEGLGPATGTPVPMDLIIASGNALAADLVATQVIGQDPRRVKYLRYATKAGLGPKTLAEIRVLGCAVASVQRRFKTAQEAVEEQYREMGIRVVARNACSGCWTEFRHIYYELKEDRAKLKGYTFVLGRVDEVPKGDKVVVLGDCAAAGGTGGAYCPGCPPHHTVITETVRKLMRA